MSFHPQTPQSPSQLSPNSTDPMSSVNTSMASITSTLPTPAHSVNGMGHDAGATDDSPQKRKRADDDVGDREQKKLHVDDGSLSIADLHLDVGEPYLLCRRSKAPLAPLRRPARPSWRRSAPPRSCRPQRPSVLVVSGEG